jgi:phosphatidate cytidylyltransferase
MERALKNRLTFGSMMLVVLFLLLWLDDEFARRTRQWMETRYDAQGVRGGVGGVGLMVVLALILPVAVQEIAVLFTAENVRPYRFIAAAGCSLLMMHAFLTQFPPFQPIAASSFAFIIVFIMLAAALRRAWAKTTQDAILKIAGTILATLYLGGLAWFLMAIRVKRSPAEGGFHGTTWTILSILLMVKSTDIGAYFGGRKFGKHKLIPWLSPGKTWEGLFFGLLTAGIVGALATGNWVRAINPEWKGEWLPHVPWWKGFIFGVIIGFIGQCGDLLESMMKRDAEVKDSGNIIPGFGGILDVIDSPLVAAPFAYLLFSFFG